MTPTSKKKVAKKTAAKQTAKKKAAKKKIVKKTVAKKTVAKKTAAKKTVSRKTTAKRQKPRISDDEKRMMIAMHAYYKWENAGFPSGEDWLHWLEAEKEVEDMLK